MERHHPRERGWWRSTHASRHYYDCAVELGLPPWEQVRRSVPLRLRPEDTGRAHGIIQRAVGTTTGERPVVGLHPGGAGLRGLKRWPAERFAELADRLVECHGARVLLLGGEDDQEVACEVRHRMRHSPAELTGDLSLWDTFALISECDLFIGNDSSLLHAAAALGTPYIGIFGPTHVPNFHPLPRDPDQGVVVQPEVPCHRPQYFVGGSTIWYRQCCEGVCRELASISVDRVFRPAVALLERRQPVREPDM